jgi:2'-5' RNA ligase
VALSVCLTFDARSEATLRGLWRRLEAAGVPTLLTHTHGRHVPHLTLMSVREHDVAAVTEALEALPVAAAGPLHLDALGAFRRSRCWLAPAVSQELAARQEAVADAVAATGAVLHRHYEPGLWLPHVTLAPRLHLHQLPVVAAAVFDVLPLAVVVERCELVETGTGERRPLRHLV